MEVFIFLFGLMAKTMIAERFVILKYFELQSKSIKNIWILRIPNQPLQ